MSEPAKGILALVLWCLVMFLVSGMAETYGQQGSITFEPEEGLTFFEACVRLDGTAWEDCRTTVPPAALRFDVYPARYCYRFRWTCEGECHISDYTEETCVEVPE